MRKFLLLAVPLLLALSGCHLGEEHGATKPIDPDGYSIIAECQNCPENLDTAGPIPLKMTFTLNNTQGVYQIAWDFGDNSGQNGLAVSHEYLAVGQYCVTATVRLNDDRFVDLPADGCFGVTAFPPLQSVEALSFAQGTATNNAGQPRCRVTREVFRNQIDPTVFVVKLTFETFEEAIFNLFYQDFLSGNFRVKQDPTVKIPIDHHDMDRIPPHFKDVRVYDLFLLQGSTRRTTFQGLGECASWDSRESYMVEIPPLEVDLVNKE